MNHTNGKKQSTISDAVAPQRHSRRCTWLSDEKGSVGECHILPNWEVTKRSTFKRCLKLFQHLKHINSTRVSFFKFLLTWPLWCKDLIVPVYLTSLFDAVSSCELAFSHLTGFKPQEVSETLVWPEPVLGQIKNHHFSGVIKFHLCVQVTEVDRELQDARSVVFTISYLVDHHHHHL